jgi:uncharacterized protein
MSRDPAELLDLAALVAQGSELEIDCELKSLTRLAPLLSDPGGAAHGRFRFHRVGGAPAAHGRVTATLPVTCQRCMGDLAIAVDAECRLVFADRDTADAQVPAEEELVATHGGRISLAELIEEELLLAMPLVAMHGEGTGCATRAGPEPQTTGEPKQRPFAGLRELMKD